MPSIHTAWLAAALVVQAKEPRLPSVTLSPSVERVLRDYERAWQARDATALADLFAYDGFVLSNGAPPVRGRDAIRAEYAKAGGPLALRALEYRIDESTGYVIGAFGRSPGGEDVGKFVLALVKGQGGRWLIAADIDNSIRPPRPAAISDAWRDELTRLSEDWTRAWLVKDAATVETLAATDYSYIAPTGQVLDRAGVVGIARSPTYSLKAGTRTDLSFRPIGGDSVAIVHRFQCEGTYEGKPFKEDRRCTIVVARRDAQWRIVLEQCGANPQ
jgi:ketosteroid isomerase-like protein